ncbi:DMT family transporter [Orbus mooreae]|uniref:DMT family transporter n=1 Tax=Orbus mooreae TaxID=3074107 RepID=UPI00370D1EA4
MKSAINMNSAYGFIAVLLAAFLWGTTGTAASFAPDLSPLTVGAVAMGCGGLLQALLARKNILCGLNHLNGSLRYLLLGALSVAIYPLAFYSSMYLAGITIGTVVSIGSAPLFTALLEKFFDKKTLSMTWFICFILGVLGVIFLSMGESHPDSIAETNRYFKIVGIILGVIAGLTYSLYSWAAKKMMGNGLDAKASMGLIFGIGALLLLPTVFYTGTNIFDAASHFYVLSYMALIPMFLGYVLFGYGLKTISASKAITLTLFEPVIAALLAIFLVGEQLTFIGWLGMVLIFLCLIILSRVDT